MPIEQPASPRGVRGPPEPLELGLLDEARILRGDAHEAL